MFLRWDRCPVLERSKAVEESSLPMNLVAAGVSLLHLNSKGSQGRLTLAVTVQGFKARGLDRGSLSPGERDGVESSTQLYVPGLVQEEDCTVGEPACRFSVGRRRLRALDPNPWEDY